jgi:secreted PhoX family phosphatase
VLVVKGRPQYDTRVGQRVGEVLEVEWVTIPQPDTDQPNISTGFVFNQVAEAARFSRLEGCWWGDAGCYFTATSGGDAGAGQVFKYDPTSATGGELTLVFESPSFAVLNSPDNICISPRGGIVLCEDGSGQNFVRGLTPGGEVFDIVGNNVNDAEWAGATWAPQGRTLFVNIQGSTSAVSSTFAATYAVWGPWESGCL